MVPVGPNEADRLTALRHLAIMDTPDEAHFDAICRLARDLFSVPIALVSLVEEDRQWFKAKCGTDLDGTARGIAFCNYTILSDDVLVVEDATCDPRFAANPMVHGEQAIRFYAGAPLILRPGIHVGALCIKDRVARTFSPEQVRQLRDLAEIVVAHLRLHEAKRSEEAERSALQSARDTQRIAEMTASFGHWRIEVADRTITWSDGLASIFGRPMPEGGRIDLDTHMLVYHPDQRDFIRRSVEEMIAGTRIEACNGFQGQRRVIRLDGAERIVTVRSVPVRDHTGKATSIYGVLLDVTEQTVAEERLHETGELLRATLENMDQGLICYGPDQRVRVHNRRAREIIDLPPHVLHDGVCRADVHRFLVERGEFADDADHLGRMARSGERVSAPAVFEQVRPDGTILEVRGATMNDGGVVWTFADITRRREAERAVRASEASYRLLADNASDMVVRRSAANVRTYVSPSSLELLGFTPEEMLTIPLSETIHPDDARSSAAMMDSLLAGLIDQGCVTHRNRHKDGRWIWVEARCRLVRDEGGMPVEIISTVRDISERKAAADALRASEAHLRVSEQRLALALDSGEDCLFDWDLATGALWVTERWREKLCLVGDLAQPSTSDWMAAIHPDDRANVIAATSDHLKGLTPALECEYRVGRAGGSAFWVLARARVASRTQDGRALRLVGTLIDISQRKEAEARIAHMALHDALTGLPNRNLFQECLDLALRRAALSASRHAVLALDLDRFKAVNDTYGHVAGDRVLCLVAERLRATVRNSDTVARLGGDEFAVILCDIANEAETGRICERIIAAVDEPLLIDGRVIDIGMSIGFALLSDDGASAAEVFKRADMALFEAKAAGRDTYRMFDAEAQARVAVHSLLALDMKEAIRRGDFFLMYQPIIDVTRGAVASFEALMRWQHPEHGLISPAEFIPVAEETGLIVPLGAWALKEACREALNWPASVCVSVNVSAVQFRGKLEEAVITALASTGLPAARLKLEVTESLLLHNPEQAVAVLHRLRALGVRIALDDFGTGYSSLSYLRRFPFDLLKIDRSFVRDIADPDTAAIVRAIVGIGERLGMGIVVEGVETSEQLELVQREGCTQVQGYLFSKPLPAVEAHAFAEAHRARAA